MRVSVLKHPRFRPVTVGWKGTKPRHFLLRTVADKSIS